MGDSASSDSRPDSSTAPDARPLLIGPEKNSLISPADHRFPGIIERPGNIVAIMGLAEMENTFVSHLTDIFEGNKLLTKIINE